MKRRLLTICLALLGLVAISTTSRAAPEAIITVTSTGDAIAADGACTLREAITAANTNSIVNECPAGSIGLDTIGFAIGSIGSQQTIQPTSALPAITDPIVIDGWSQGGAGYAGPPLIEINGSAIATWNTTNGLQLTAGSSTVRGLAINYFNIAISLESAGNNVIAGNYLGLALDGVTPIGNRTGLRIAAASDGNRIGTNGDGIDDAAERNVISASGFVQQNNSTGILIDQGSDNNWIAGNFIGTDATGTQDRGNASSGITTGGVTIIGTNGDGVGDAVEGNLIAGNNSHGVALASTSSGSRVAGNKIGTDLTGAIAIPNNSNGLSVGSCSAGQCSNYIIGTNGDGVSDALEGNLISGNGAGGVFIPAGTLSNNVIAGNKIGTNAAGTAAVPNGDYGVHLGGDFSRLGTNNDGVSDDLEGNLISGNGDGAGNDNHGVVIPGGSDHNVIAGNRIGANAAGTAAIPNGQTGLRVEDDYNTVTGNLIS
ncbi:MAG: CSLREA domain-containing protein, partial [Chloroflexi bacterium]|nr:CSLREA domain-containing protein [Chloroflexota bacterium]